jgi:hypothetical protein
MIYFESVRSGLSLENCQQFVSALEDKPINIRDGNSPGLCSDF